MTMSRRAPDGTGSLMPFQDLVGRQEIAQHLECTVSAVDTWRHRYPSFPPPLLTLSGTPIWRWADVIEWHRAHPRKPGRPRKSKERANA